MKMLTKILALSVAMTTVPLASAQTVLTSAVYNGHTYSLLSNSNWTDAEAKAVSMGGHLATINDLSENDFLVASFAAFGGVNRNLWIGLNDVVVEGTYVWSSGEVSAYRKWAPNQPDNGNYTPQGEDYIHLFKSGIPFQAGSWNDAPDFSDFSIAGVGLQYGVVEAVPESASFAALGLGVLALLRRRKQG